MVFVGGSVTELYADDSAAIEVRPTLDVDCVVEISSHLKYYELEKNLRHKGFKNDTTPNAPVCRWIYKDVIVDVMPIDGNLLGFTNRWYFDGVMNKQEVSLPDETVIYIFSAPYYLGAKFEAVLSRGGNDLRMSHDFEDIIYILDNVKDIINQISFSELEIREYLATQFRILLTNSNIEEVIECALPYGSGERVNYIIDILSYNYLS